MQDTMLPGLLDQCRKQICSCTIFVSGHQAISNNITNDGATEVNNTGYRYSWVQELQADLHGVMRLAKRSAEYQLAIYMGAGSQYVKHRDALPDDGADPNQRRVGSTSFACSYKAIQALVVALKS